VNEPVVATPEVSEEAPPARAKKTAKKKTAKTTADDAPVAKKKAPSKPRARKTAAKSAS
jgi:hypothetical protein